MKLKFLFFIFLLNFICNSVYASENPYENLNLTNEHPVKITDSNLINLTEPDNNGHWDYIEINGNQHNYHTGRLNFSTSPYVIDSDGNLINQIDGISWIDQVKIAIGQGDNNLTTSDDSGDIQIKNSYYSSLIKEHVTIAKPVNEIGYNFNTSLQDWTTIEPDMANNTTETITTLGKDSRVDVTLDKWGNAVVYINGANSLVLPVPIAKDAAGNNYTLFWELDNSDKILKIGNLGILKNAVYPVIIDPTNILTNYGFETGSLTPWTYSSSPAQQAFFFSITSSGAHSGTYCCYSVGTSGDSESYGYTALGSLSQTVYSYSMNSFSFWYRYSLLKGGLNYLRAYYGSEYYSFNQATSYTQFSHSFSSTGNLSASVQMSEASTYVSSNMDYENAHYYYFDDFDLEGSSNNAVTPYSFSNNTTWTCPSGVYNIDIYGVGPGGGGGTGGLGAEALEVFGGTPTPGPEWDWILPWAKIYWGGGGGGGGSGACISSKLNVTPGHTYYIYLDTTSSKFNYDQNTNLISIPGGGHGYDGTDASFGILTIDIPVIQGGGDGTGGAGGSAGSLGGQPGNPGQSGGYGGIGGLGYFIDGSYRGTGGSGGRGAYGYPDQELEAIGGNASNLSQSWWFTRIPGSSGNLGYIRISYAQNNSSAYTPTASFNTNVTSGLAPLSVQFNDSSSGFPTSWNWNFGDGTSSTTQNPVHTYSTPGTYQVTLTVSNSGGSDSTPPYYKTITVTSSQGPGGIVDFRGDPLQGNAPLSVSFTDLSGNSPASWNWDFGDGFTSSNENPVHTYTAAGTYTVKLDAGGIWQNKTNYINVRSPSGLGGYLTPTWHASPISGLPPLSVQFTEDTLGASSRTWDFGDGNTSIAVNPSHIYYNSGLYDIKYSATNASGTVWLNRTGYISVNTRIPTYPVPDFQANPQSGLNPLTVQFTDYSIGSPASWYWDFGDGSTSTSQNPVHTFQNIGAFTVKLQATNANGSYWMNKTGYISTYNFFPQADFSGSPTTGNAPLTVYFTDSSSIGQSNNPITSWHWDFGDGQSSTVQNPTHVYNLAGAYTVRLKVSSASGSNWMNKTNYISVQTPPVANFIGTPTTGNTPLTVSFTDQSYGSPTSWNWNFGDGGTSTIQNPSHTYTSSGSYTVTLTATNAYGSNTITKTNYIAVQTPPVANFTASPTSGNSPLLVNFVDTSYGSPTSWSWNFGDGNTSTSRYPSHAYFASGSYTVSLTVTNAYGSNTITKANFIQVNVPPTAEFSAAPQSGYAPMNVNFYDRSTGGPTSWNWNFGDGTTSTSSNPSHTYSLPGNYTVSLTVSNVYGTNTKTITNYITVLSSAVTLPVANFAGSPTSGNAPLSVAFTDLSSGSPTSWVWNFGDGNTSTAQNPSHTYSAAGSYTITLTVTNGNGTNSLTKTNYISVSSPTVTIPVANFAGSPTSGNSPLTVSFTDSSSGSPTSWVWDFGDGGTSTAQNPSHTYTSSGSYTVTLTATNGNGSNSQIKNNYINVTSVNAPIADFSGSPTSGDSPLTVTFADHSIGSPTSWVWDFGDGNTSTLQNPSHTYSNTGSYTVSLTASNSLGSTTKTKANYIIVGGGTIAPPGLTPVGPTPDTNVHKTFEDILVSVQPFAADLFGLVFCFWFLTFIQVVFM